MSQPTRWEFKKEEKEMQPEPKPGLFDKRPFDRSSAVERKADYMISGDHHLKDLGAYHGIEILDPGAF